MDECYSFCDKNRYPTSKHNLKSRPETRDPGPLDMRPRDPESWEQDPENWTCDTDS